MTLIKGLIPGLILTLVVSLILGSNGSAGGWLHVHRVDFEGHHWYWSWTLFIISTAGAWGIFKIMP